MAPHRSLRELHRLEASTLKYLHESCSNRNRDRSYDDPCFCVVGVDANPAMVELARINVQKDVGDHGARVRIANVGVSEVPGNLTFYVTPSKLHSSFVYEKAMQHVEKTHAATFKRSHGSASVTIRCGRAKCSPIASVTHRTYLLIPKPMRSEAAMFASVFTISHAPCM